VSSSTGAVFLSYASEDAAAAQRIAEALRAAGVEVWFDREELRGGDAWDHKIRDQIHDCRLFIPVISANTERRDEGYFRREWRLAVERVGDMTHKRAFLVPVVIDGTPERGASVPDKFHELQWTRLPGGETPSAFVERITRLLTPDTSATTAAAGSTSAPISPSVRRTPFTKVAIWAGGALATVALAYFVADKLWISKHLAATRTAAPAIQQTAQPATATSTVAFAPPPHSIAVLPFVNMSGDKSQEYFSDGLTEELLDSLSRINELQVAARTSAFSFKGKDVDISTIARKLNVGSVLEGSVRRSRHTIRVTAQLINAVTGFHVWSETYDRDLSDVLKLQTEIAKAVTSALRVNLLSDVAQKIELGGTHNPAAFDAYLRGYQKAFLSQGDNEKNLQDGIAVLSEAIRLDPNFALAYAARSRALCDYTEELKTRQTIREAFNKAEADARKTIALAPDLDESHLALALWYEMGSLNFTLANEEYQRALSLAPGNVRNQWRYSGFAAAMGQPDAAISAARRAVVLDPLHVVSYQRLAYALYSARKYTEAVAAIKDALALFPDDPGLKTSLGYVFYTLGDFQSARAFCEIKPSWTCLAVSYHKLGRQADADKAIASSMASWGDTAPVAYAAVYAQWGDTAKALEWLDAAVRLRDPGLEILKVEPLFDPLRREPRFQAIERALKFPD
jgi:TolB-like protein